MRCLDCAAWWSMASVAAECALCAALGVLDGGAVRETPMQSEAADQAAEMREREEAQP